MNNAHIRWCTMQAAQRHSQARGPSDGERLLFVEILGTHTTVSTIGVPRNLSQ